MQRLWKIPTLMLAFAFLPGITQAQDPELTEKRLTQLEQQVKTLKSRMDNNQVMLEILKELRKLNERVSKLESQSGKPSVTTSKFPPSATGTLRLDNRSGLTATITVNSVEYELPPNTVQTLRDFPVGRFSYQVDVSTFGNIKPLVTRTLNEDQTFKITVYP